MHHFPELFVAHQHCIQNRMIIKGKLILVEHSHPFSWRNIHTTLVGLDIPADDFHESGLAGSIGSNDTIAIPFGETDIYFVEKHPFAIGQSDVIYINHIAKKCAKIVRIEQDSIEQMKGFSIGISTNSAQHP